MTMHDIILAGTIHHRFWMGSAEMGCWAWATSRMMEHVVGPSHVRTQRALGGKRNWVPR